MATNTIRLRKFQRLIRALFPRGLAWFRKDETDSNLRKLLDSLGAEACRIEEAGFKLIEDVDPRTTVDLLTDWERLLALPDECESSPENLTIQQRRERIVQVLTTDGGQNAQFYVDLAANFGVTIAVEDINDQLPFRVGRSRVGDRLTNGPWKYVFVVNAPFENATRFRVGQSRVGDRLLDVNNPTLNCLIQKHKPAHTIAILTFTGEF